MNEIWKDIEGYDGLYQVSNKGNVRRYRKNFRYKYNRYRLLNPFLVEGYLKVGLYMNGIMQHKLVHRLVISEFKGSYEGMQVNHMNENKKDNRIENLEWVTAKALIKIDKTD